jgi:hypothetical protein
MNISRESRVHTEPWTTLSLEEVSRRKNRITELTAQVPTLWRLTLASHPAVWEVPLKKTLQKLLQRQNRDPRNRTLNSEIRYVQERLWALEEKLHHEENATWGYILIAEEDDWEEYNWHAFVQARYLPELSP